ncbi:hypothetical protein CLG96_06405 [Sphingomonas oleivorans]|uniref:Transposase IS4-like domain-containing protein n=1 Tax=Sphingomonas oleivorans TaxID=1735121 RepID=A0A2T5FZP7_9SPHN|nr:hypothetical protein CLG96_06405 [Sphingomonas oleivorans]
MKSAPGFGARVFLSETLRRSVEHYRIAWECCEKELSWILLVRRDSHRWTEDGFKRLIADRGYDANRIRTALREQGTIPVIPGPVIPGRRNRKRPIPYDARRYKDRWRVEALFCCLKDFRRIAIR